MPKFPVKVKQIYRVTRSITMEVEADDQADARRNASFGEVDLPEWSDERWKEHWTLQGEEVE